MAIEYTAQAVSPIVNGEVKLSISEAGLAASALFDVAQIPFAEIKGLVFDDYVVAVETDDGDYCFSKMGNGGRSFYDELFGAYNRAVLRSLFIKGSPLLTACGDFTTAGAPWDEKAEMTQNVPVHVYENCIAALPPNLGARRVPLCFASGMEKGGFGLTLKLDTGESYAFTKLGYDAAPFTDAVEKQIRALREKSLATAKEIDPSLTVAQASQIAKLAPLGAAAPIGRIAAIAPSFAEALSAELAKTRAAETYKEFVQMSGAEQIYVGFRKNEKSETDEEGGADEACGADETCGADEAQPEAPASPFLLWLIAPSPDGQYAAVEFAEADSATFVYRTGGDFGGFARQLSRALEAIDFKREVIRLTESEIMRPENSDYYMASRRTAALQFVRSNFVGRAIHSSPEAWKRKVRELWGI